MLLNGVAVNGYSSQHRHGAISSLVFLFRWFTKFPWDNNWNCHRSFQEGYDSGIVSPVPRACFTVSRFICILVDGVFVAIQKFSDGGRPQMFASQSEIFLASTGKEKAFTSEELREVRLRPLAASLNTLFTFVNCKLPWLLWQDKSRKVTQNPQCTRRK